MIIYFADIIERTLRGICDESGMPMTHGLTDQHADYLHGCQMYHGVHRTGDEAGESPVSCPEVVLGTHTFCDLDEHCSNVLREAARRFVASHGSIYVDGAEARELDLAALHKYMRYILRPLVESGFDIATNLPFVLGHFVAADDRVITPALLAEQFVVEFAKVDRERLFECSVGGPVNGMGYINAASTGRLFELIACDEACERISALADILGCGSVERVFDNLMRRRVNVEEVTKLFTARAVTFEQVRCSAADYRILDGWMPDDYTMLFFLSYFPECQVDAYLKSFGSKQNFPWLCRQALKDIDICLGVYGKIFGSQRLYTELGYHILSDNASIGSTAIHERQSRFVKVLLSFAKQLLELRGNVLEASRLYQPGRFLVIQKELIDGFYCIYNHPDVRNGRMAEVDEGCALVFYSLLFSVRSAIRCLYQAFGLQIGNSSGAGWK